VSPAGSIDWCCLPRLDSPSVFGRILDWDAGGHFQIVPRKEYRVSRRYLEDTLVLETTFSTDSGEVRLLDAFTMRRGGRERPHRQVVRVVEGIQGAMDLDVLVAPRFDYGDIRPWIRDVEENAFAAIGGNEGLLIYGDVGLEVRERNDLAGSVRVKKGRRVRLSFQFAPPEDLDRHDPVEVPDAEELDRRLDETVAWWREWVKDSGRWPETWRDAVQQSALVLKGLTNARTGAIAAAATTSLPEVDGGESNWDYRSSWIRDSTWAVRALGELGYEAEADGFRRFSERSAAGSTEDLQVMYGLGGEHRLGEAHLEDLEGYRGAKPVRIGNAAARQQQHDVYGELVDLAWRWYARGHTPDRDYWRFLVDVVNEASRRWTEPDSGVWELRDEPRHYVHSKVICWAALDHGIRLARAGGQEAPIEQWAEARDRVREAVETRGYDQDRGVFVRAFDTPEMDAALLLLPRVWFVAWDDERMVRTTDAVRKELDADGLLYRFRQPDDGPGEGAFITCSFWLVECLVRQGRRSEAEEVFERASKAANDLGLFSEEVDPATGDLLGNFPQGLSHMSFISAALALTGVDVDGVPD
jgi:GH15 family glucan-1,4-alpha-glucosidase